MTTTNTPTLREEVEDFLFREAELLDDWLLDDWVALFTEDGRYIVPTTGPARRRPAARPRVHRRRHRPPARPGRPVEQPPRPPRVPVVPHPSLRLQRPRPGNRRGGTLGDRQRHGLPLPQRGGRTPTSAASTTTLRRADGGLKIAYRRAVLDLEALSWHGAVSIIF